MIHAGNERQIPAEGLEKVGFLPLAHDQGHIEFGSFHPLGVLVELSPSGASGHRDHLGMRQQGALHDAPEAIRFGQRGARQRHGTNGQGPFIKIRQKSPSDKPRGHDGGPKKHQGGHGDQPGTPQCKGKDGGIAGLEDAYQRRFMPPAHRPAPWQEEGTEHRGDGDGHGEGGQERDDIGRPQGLEEASFHPRKEKQGEKHQHDNERGKDNRGADSRRWPRRRPGALGGATSAGSAAFSRSRRKTFSTSITASSTRAPMAMAIPPRVMVLMVAPNACKIRTVVRSDRGIAVNVMKAALRLARKSSTMAMTRIPPSRRA